MTYVLSDVHGNKENFDSIMGKINLQPEDTLYILGDMVDRYPYGIQLIQQVMEMPNVHMLLGNHEWMMMRALDIVYTGFPEAEAITEPACESIIERFSLWYRNQGKVTYDAWSRLSAEEKEKVSVYLSGLPLSYEVNVNGRRFKLVHAAPVELYRKYPTEFDNVIEFAVWDRGLPGYWQDPDSTVIFGHTPTSYLQDRFPLEIWEDKNMIGIDCGSGSRAVISGLPTGGRLSCLRLDDMKVFYSG